MTNIVQLPRLHRTLGPVVPANPRAPGLSVGQWVALVMGLLIGMPLLYLAICAMLVAG